MGCQGGGFFALFSGQPAQCGPLNNQIQQTRANLDRTMAEIQRLQGNSAEREGQRRVILVALGQNDCGPQYRHTPPRPRRLLRATCSAGARHRAAAQMLRSSGTYRTLCVRTCDGYYFPISYSTVPSKFADDERLCQRLCPAAKPCSTAIAIPARTSRARCRPAAGSTRSCPPRSAIASSSTRLAVAALPGQSWAEALQQARDQTIERGDIVVTEERAKPLSQPRFDAQAKAVNASQAPARGKGADEASSAPASPAGAEQQPPAPAEQKGEQEPGKRKVRAVGPTFYPVR